MANNLFSFLGQSQQDPSAQAGLNQYIQQGQSQINPGAAKVAASDPISMAGIANLANALRSQSSTAALPAQLPTGVAQQALGQNNLAATTPQMADNAQFMNPDGQMPGQAGPTPQALQMAQALMQQPNAIQNGNSYSFLNPSGGQ